jgi:hypothetical protein
MAQRINYLDFISSAHPLYQKYYDDWLLAVKSFYGGVEYRDGNYLKAYDTDYTTPSEVINTYDVDEYGVQTAKYSTQKVNSSSQAEHGTQYASNFYQEKLQNVPVFPYTRLYTSEYNAILFRSPPSRVLPDTPEVNDFLQNADSEGNSLNEFMSMVDTFTTVFGVVWVSCLKPAGAEYARWRMHKPLDVLNWNYIYNADGDLELERIVIRVAQEQDLEVYQYMTKDELQTIFMPLGDDDIDESMVPEGAEILEDREGKGFYKITQPNELGYIPVRPVYQSNKIQNGVGHTPIFDIAQIQRSVYSDMGEIYSAVSYGAHPVNIVDEETLDRNGGSVGAEPGSVIITQNRLNGQPNYVFEFASPPLDAISEVRELMDQKIAKMNEVAMIRSEELIKASRSGVQIEMYDSKLEAFVRKKATAMEQAEFNLWKIWFDWQDQDMPEDLSISYNRLYSQKGVEHEIKEMNILLDAFERYNQVFMLDVTEFVPRDFATIEEAEAEASRLGGTGHHEHELEDGTIVYMPFNNHKEYEIRLEIASGLDQEERQAINKRGFKEELRDQIAERLNQLIDSTYSKNSL